ncbi:uncharacterized protein [Rutidosis leptorrhynchoides]|uniref:uncharacterized protein n=1 Tax=Rutidosis leptorrhynchoides TaxID=125765 RepID=UPI003A9A31AD
MVRDKIIWDRSNWVGNWNWIRDVTGLVRGELQELNGLLVSVSISSQSADYWAWIPGSQGIFKTKMLTYLINAKVLQTNDSIAGTLRNNYVPKKVELFVWRARKGRIPMLPELDKKGIDLNSVRCPICDDDIETLDHSLLSCKLSKDIWEKTFEWWHMGNVSSTGKYLSDLGKSIWKGVLWTSGYLMWKNRNDNVLKNKCWNIPVAISEIRVKSFEWIAKRCKLKNIE